jgi:hypothetical protein
MYKFQLMWVLDVENIVNMQKKIYTFTEARWFMNAACSVIQPDVKYCPLVRNRTGCRISIAVRWSNCFIHCLALYQITIPRHCNNTDDASFSVKVE